MGLEIFFRNPNLTGIPKGTWFGDKVDEKGSTAAAATFIPIARSTDFVYPEIFICDHSFAYLIVDQKLDEVLFAGVYDGK